jgi:hypothetical protein
MGTDAMTWDELDTDLNQRDEGGSVVHVVRRHPFAFTLPASATETLVLERALRLETARQILFRTRVHTALVAGAGLMRVRVYAVFPSACDPSLDFVRMPALATHAIEPRVPSGTLLQSRLDRDAVHVPALRVTLEVISGGTLTATLSVDFVARA